VIFIQSINRKRVIQPNGMAVKKGAIQNREEIIDLSSRYLFNKRNYSIPKTFPIFYS